MDNQHSPNCNVIRAGAPEYLGPADCNCDGYHTFDELYDHRIALYIALCRMRARVASYEHTYVGVWRSKRHSDGELCFGDGKWFVLGIGKEPGEQITYHLPMSRWDETDFAETLNRAPEWDGHMPGDVLSRLKAL
jgi:hypothetical protein